MVKIHIEYLETTFNSKITELKGKIQNAIDFLENIKKPSKEELYTDRGTKIGSVKEKIYTVIKWLNSASENLTKAQSIAEEKVKAIKYAENQVIELSQDMSFLAEGTVFYSTSAGGGNTGYIGNEWIKEGDNLSVGYLAVYSNGRYVGSISIYDEKKETLEEAINRYKEEGKIGEDDKITISQGLVKDLGEGKYGDVGWLDQIDYEEKSIDLTLDEEQNDVEGALGDDENQANTADNEVEIDEELPFMDIPNGIEGALSYVQNQINTADNKPEEDEETQSSEPEKNDGLNLSLDDTKLDEIQGHIQDGTIEKIDESDKENLSNDINAIRNYKEEYEKCIEEVSELEDNIEETEAKIRLADSGDTDYNKEEEEENLQDYKNQLEEKQYYIEENKDEYSDATMKLESYNARGFIDLVEE